MSIKKMRSIFVMQGILVAVFGSLLGLLIGGLIALAQKTFGLLKLAPGPGAKPYPVVFNPFDFVVILFIVISIAFVTSFIRMLIAKFDQKSLGGVLK